jgi:glycosyltransferase involved in cell wall biosynthesis
MKPCFLIPCYDHGRTIRPLVAGLSAHGLPIYIVDDGSHEETRLELLGVRAAFPLVRLSRLPVNGGKGAAVMHGMRHARADGMTHALQIDADGQHDIQDVPRFLARGAERSEALLLGQPIFDHSVPWARLYGRKLTNFLVCVETLSLSIKDALCGFRLYPLAPCCELVDSVALPPRMAFDSAILVRLAWRGVPVENLPTRVVYPPGGLSHFRMLRDNALLTASHTLLVLGMLARLPRLLRRRLPVLLRRRLA